MPYEKLTEKHLTNLKNDISDTMSSKNLDSSGEASSSLRVDENKLLGADYIVYLDQGRGPGNFPPVRNIAEWVRRKLSVDQDHVKSVAFLVGRKIAREGTKIFKNRSKGLQLDDLIQKNLNNLRKELPSEAKAEVLKLL